MKGIISQNADRAVGDGGQKSETPVLNEDVEAVAAEKPSNARANDNEGPAAEYLRSQEAKMNNIETNSKVSASSSIEDSYIKTIASGPSSVQAGLGGADTERPALKLRTRMPTRLKTLSRRLANPKKRHASIYDLDEDEEADQTQYGLGKPKPGSDGTNLQPSNVRKRLKIIHSKGDQMTVHSESRLGLRGAGGFSAIRDGFYFPR